MKICNIRSFIGVMSLFLFLVTMPLVVYAGSPPRTMNYQGYLTNSSGSPMNGTVIMNFCIYDAPTGGDMLWNETHNSVTVEKGIFSVILGESTPLNLVFDKPYYLGIEVNGDGEMSPRQPMTGVPHALEKSRLIIWSAAGPCDDVVTEGWYTYKPSGTPDYFSNADGYFTVNTNGTVTFQTSGFYRISGYTGSFCTCTNLCQLKVRIYHTYQGGSSNIYWQEQSCRESNVNWSIDHTWLFAVGDTIELEFYSYGGKAYCGGKLQIMYMGIPPSD